MKGGAEWRINSFVSVFKFKHLRSCGRWENILSLESGCEKGVETVKETTVTDGEVAQVVRATVS